MTEAALQHPDVAPTAPDLVALRLAISGGALFALSLVSAGSGFFALTPMVDRTTHLVLTAVLALPVAWVVRACWQRPTAVFRRNLVALATAMFGVRLWVTFIWFHQRDEGGWDFSGFTFSQNVAAGLVYLAPIVALAATRDRSLRYEPSGRWMAAAGAASVAVSLPASWYSVGRFTDEARPAAAMGLRWAGDDSTALVGFSDVALLAVAMGVLVVSLVRDDVRTARRTWPMFVPVMVVPVLMATGSRSSNIEFSLWMGLALAGLVAIGFGIASSDREPHGDFERVDRPTADRPTEAVDASNASADDAHGEPVPLLDRLTVAAAGAGWLVYGAVTALLVAALAAPIGDPAGGSITIYADAAETIERFLRGLTISWHVVVGLVLLVRTAAEPRATWSRPFTVLLSVLPVVLVSSGMLVA